MKINVNTLPRLCGHRGMGSDEFQLSKYGKIKYNENTIQAFNNAFYNGIQMIELDVHFYNNEILVVHDYDKLTSNTLKLSKVVDMFNYNYYIDIELKYDNLPETQFNIFIEKLLFITAPIQNNVIYSSFSEKICNILIQQNRTVFFIFDRALFNLDKNQYKNLIYNIAKKYKYVVFDAELFNDLKYHLHIFDCIYLYGTDVNDIHIRQYFLNTVHGVILDDINNTK